MTGMEWKEEKTSMTDKWMTVRDVADYLQLSKDQIYRLAQQGRIPASKVGRGWRFRKEKIDQWVEEQGVSSKK